MGRAGFEGRGRKRPKLRGARQTAARSMCGGTDSGSRADREDEPKSIAL